MNIQQQEELDYEAGCFKNEFQAASANSVLTRKSDDTAKIAEAVKNGKFVVSLKSPSYCRHTDAFIGYVLTFIEAFETLTLAEAKAATIEGEGEVFPIIHCPREITSPKVSEISEDIPF